MSDVTKRIGLYKLAALLGVSSDSIRRWTKKGLLPRPEKQGRQNLYDMDEVREAIANNKLPVND